MEVSECGSLSLDKPEMWPEQIYRQEMGLLVPSARWKPLIQEVTSYLAIGKFHSFLCLVQTSFLEEASVEKVDDL